LSRSFPLTPRGSSAINTYDEYGKPGAANQDRFQYTGQAWIPELGLYYYKTRFYAPHLGRFMQTDRVSYASGPNLYAYVAGDPVNWTDPTGEFVNIVAGAVIGLGLDYASQVALNLASGKSGKDAFWTSINKHELIASAALGTLTGTGLLWAGATGTARFAPAYLRPIVGELANPIK
jgi:RHS repeat-associated protein